MIFNKFILNIIIRSILIAATALIMMFFATKTEWVFTFSFTGLLFVLQIFLLIRYVSKINRDAANFLIHLREQNTSLNISEKYLDPIFGNLSKEMHLMNEEFKKIENEKIRKQNFINILLDRVGTGILVIDSNNDIKLFNKAMLKIIDVDNETLKEISSKSLRLIEDCKNLKIGEQSINNIQVNNLTRRILTTFTEIKEDDQKLRIYTFHDIDREMTDYELQSWNGIIKVLSHEILNTLTPMSTSIDTLKDCLLSDDKVKENSQLSSKDIHDSAKGIHLLENRINSLQEFIVRFRKFLDIPIPELKPLNLIDVIAELTISYKDKINIVISDMDRDLIVLADQSLIEMVLINLIKNSLEANATKINIGLKKLNKEAILVFKDDGSGMSSSVLKKAFLPFYTTKESGSGIGLSFSKQIMHAHKGSIEISSNENGTEISLFFKTQIN